MDTYSVLALHSPLGDLAWSPLPDASVVVAPAPGPQPAPHRRTVWSLGRRAALRPATAE
jgi:hypothetical protein